MAKLIVEIHIDDDSKEKLEAYIKENEDSYFPTQDKTMISVDATYLRIDPTDDSFYLFKLRGIED